MTCAAHGEERWQVFREFLFLVCLLAHEMRRFFCKKEKKSEHLGEEFIGREQQCTKTTRPRRCYEKKKKLECCEVKRNVPGNRDFFCTRGTRTCTVAQVRVRLSSPGLFTAHFQSCTFSLGPAWVLCRHGCFQRRAHSASWQL